VKECLREFAPSAEASINCDRDADSQKCLSLIDQVVAQ
jgi:hypothetical protein